MHMCIFFLICTYMYIHFNMNMYMYIYMHIFKYIVFFVSEYMYIFAYAIPCKSIWHDTIPLHSVAGLTLSTGITGASTRATSPRATRIEAGTSRNNRNGNLKARYTNQNSHFLKDLFLVFGWPFWKIFWWVYLPNSHQIPQLYPLFNRQFDDHSHQITRYDKSSPKGGGSPASWKRACSPHAKIVIDILYQTNIVV